MNTPVVHVSDVTTVLGGQTIVEDITFSVESGEILVILGPSGCGKSTVMRSMLGLVTPQRGEVRYWGTSFLTLAEEERLPILRRIGVSFQSGGLFNSLSLRENIALPLRQAREYDETLIDDIVRMKLGLVGLAEAIDKEPSELSGGMRKRAGLARAIALDPDLVLLDEPSAGLDPVTAAGIDELILLLRDIMGLTVVVVTHELESIKLLADHVVMLDAGRIVFEGTLDEALSVNHPKVRQFFDRRPDSENRGREEQQ